MKNLLSTLILLSIGTISFLTLTTAVAKDKVSSNSNSNDREINGTVSSVSTNSFVVRGRVINVTPNTLIDDSIIENARGVELSNDLPFGGLPESLQQLLPVGLNVEVQLDNSNGSVAISIEDN